MLRGRLLLEEIDKEHQDQEVMVIGDAQIDLKETELLKLPPGTAVNPKLSHHDFDCASEILNVKLRYEQRTWEEHDSDVRAGIEAYKWMELEEQEKIKKAEEEANLRQIFDPMHGILNFSKKRVTDSSHNTFVKLPKELSADLETFNIQYLNDRRRILLVAGVWEIVAVEDKYHVHIDKWISV